MPTKIKTSNITDRTITAQKITEASIGGFEIASGAIAGADIASTFDISGKTVTLPAASVTTHVTQTDLSPVRNDIATLALHSAIADNKAAHNLSNSFIDQFESDAGIDTETTCDRNAAEYMSSIGTDANVLFLMHSDTTHNSTVFVDSSASARSISVSGSPDHTTGYQKFGASAIKCGGTNESVYTAASTDFNVAGDFTLDFWVKLDRWNSDAEALVGIGSSTSTGGDSSWINMANSSTGTANMGLHVAGSFVDTAVQFGTSAWYHNAVVRSGTGTNNVKYYLQGSQTAQLTDTDTLGTGGSGTPMLFIGHSGNRYCDANFDEVRFTSDARTTIAGDPMYISSGTSFSVPTAVYDPVSTNATGNFTSANQTALSSVSSMGIVVLYKDNAGTASLNGDLVCQVSANGGTNYSNATLVAGGTFSTGIKIAAVSGVSVTAGTAPKYKISFANQAQGSKETQVHGVALLY